MAVDKLPSGRYRTRVFSKGRVVASRTFDRKKDALAFDRAQKTALASGSWSALPSQTATVAEVAETWMSSRSIAARTRDDYRRLLDQTVLPAWGRCALVTIQPSEVRAWAVSLHRRSPHVARRALIVLRQVFKVALADGLVPRSPVEGVRLPSPKAGTPTPLTVDQLRALLDAMPTDKDRLLTAVMGYGGLRFGEASALRVADLRADHLYLARSVQPAAGGGWHWGDLKNHQSRRVPLPRAVMEALHAFAAEKAADALLFPSRSGFPLRGGSWSRWVLGPACETAGVPRITPHALRDTAATEAIRLGAPVTAVARLLGHQDASVTLRHYAKAFDDDLTAIAQRFEEEK